MCVCMLAQTQRTLCRRKSKQVELTLTAERSEASASQVSHYVILAHLCAGHKRGGQCGASGHSVVLEV